MNRSTRGRGGRARGWRSTLGLLALAAVSLPPVAAAGLERGEDTAPKPPPLVNPLTLDVAGKRVGPNVCEYTSTLEVAPGEVSVREDVIAVDDATCTMRVQRGVPADLAEPADEPGSSTKTGEATPKPDRSLAGAGRALATHSKGYHKSYFEDPPGIDVNSVRNDVDWVWNGSTVSNGLCSYTYGWFAASGWGLKENNFFCRYENSQTQLRSSSYVHFKNGIFCLFIDTHTYYERNNAYGKWNGNLVGTISW
ncbi:MAG: hypothetical protein ACRDM9_13305, partial [Gaiellaceae bacterium]